MFHDWDLTQEEFDRLLAWLHPEREGAARKYEDIRARVYKTMTGRGCVAAAEIFDEAVHRIARKLPGLLVDYEGDPALYFYGVAKLVHLEYLRDQRETAPLSPILSARAQANVEREYECLDECLNQLLPGDKSLLLRFYHTKKQAKIDDHKELAQELGITRNALRLRLFRLRQSLATCIKKCRDEKKS